MKEGRQEKKEELVFGAAANKFKKNGCGERKWRIILIIQQE